MRTRYRVAMGMGAAVALMACVANPLAPPTAADIVAKPAASSMKDAHATVHATGSGVAINGEGTMVFKPKFAIDLQLSTSIGTIPVVFETISIGGTNYTRTGSGKYTTSPDASSNDPTSKGTDLKIAGEETIGSDKAWHITGKRNAQPFEEWVRESDGYLLKLQSQNDQGSTFTFALDHFNTGAKVSAPPATQIKPAAKNVTGSVGQAMELNGLRLTVVSADTNAKADSAYRTPAASKRFVVAQILYEVTGSEPVDPGQWTLSDSQGFSYSQAYGVKEPPLGYAKINPGDKLRGYVAFEVPKTASGLTLKAKVGDDSASIQLQ